MDEKDEFLSLYQVNLVVVSYLLRCFESIQDLLCGPGAIFVDTNGSEMWGDAFQHGEFHRFGALVEEPLEDSIANIITTKLGDFTHTFRGIGVTHQLLRGAVEFLANVTQAVGIDEAVVAKFRDGGNGISVSRR
jgi:hypothetical protein